jgi:hypothetical protein
MDCCLVGCLEVRSFGGSTRERSPRRSPETSDVEQVLFARSFHSMRTTRWKEMIDVHACQIESFVQLHVLCASLMQYSI